MSHWQEVGKSSHGLQSNYEFASHWRRATARASSIDAVARESVPGAWRQPATASTRVKSAAAVQPTAV
jgi:hypothetical protein